MGGGGNVRIYEKLTPLTEEEKMFAEENHGILIGFLRKRNLDFDDYYDVAAFGYLKSVKSWFSREELHQYKFITIAWMAMSSYIGNNRRRESRRIQTISLDQPWGENQDCTLGDLITYENLQDWYIPRGKLTETGAEYGKRALSIMQECPTDSHIVASFTL